MLRNYVTIALRHLLRHKGYSLINILGLAVGMASCILILLHVHDELSYDQHHERADQIYRVTREWFNSDGSSSLHLGHVAPPIGPLLKNDFPGILQMVRIKSGGSPLLRHGDKVFQEERFYFSDPNIFEVFTLPLLKGDPHNALADPDGVVLTPAMARKYFGNEEPLGRVLNIDNQADLKVTGIMPDMPANSHFHFDFLGSMKLLERALGEDEFKNWGSNNYATYLLFPKNYHVENFLKAVPDFIGRHHPDGKEAIPQTTLRLQRLTDIHLFSHLDSEIEANGNIVYVYIFSAIAFFLLLIACINFMNLATARSANRAKEVGLRKVMGADRRQLIRQFLGETVVMALLALLLAVVLVEMALPKFNAFAGKELALRSQGPFFILTSLLGVTLFVGIVAGSYPAFFLSRFQPVAVLKGQKIGSARSRFRSVLVVLQFAISIILIVGMGIVYNQLEYCRTKNLGLNKEHIVVLPVEQGREIVRRYPHLKNQLLQHPQIVSVAASKRVPSGRLLDSSGGSVPIGDKYEPLTFRIANVRVDHSFIDTYGIQMAAGRNFSVDFPTDSTAAFILNETAVRKIGWPSPEAAIGKPFQYGNRQGRIIGVVKDFNYESLQQPITPVVLLIAPQSFNSISVKIRAEQPADITATLEFLKQKWQEFRPNFPFQYSFIAERYEQLYQNEHRLGRIFGAFSLLAIFIACLGLFGLASYTAEQRTKEIGVRKVLGASLGNIVFLLSKEFARLVAVATLVSWPLAYFAMSRWLQEFAYRININHQSLTFLLAALLALAIALITVSFQSLKAALANPVEALRYE
ncbi:ABC transporter permease [candidate division KSB1 bacterium]|nr:ABC transporter permease [bacterium]NUM68210.1 ABC transporter permease [candidate division KSB1 bacterium]